MVSGKTLLEENVEEDRALRPLSLADFIGQNSLKEKLSVFISSARKRNSPLDHVLFSGPPGLGKTTLAAIIASEMGSKFFSTSAPAITKPGDLVKQLTMLETGDVFFIDEIHRLGRACEEILYPALEDGVIDFILGEGLTAQSVKLHLKPFTLVGATTRSGMLSSPLKSRFGIDLKVDFYELPDLEKIVLRSARLLGLDLAEDSAVTIAGRARMTPRVANRLVRRVRDYAVVENVRTIKSEFVKGCLDHLGVDRLGLVELDRKLLRLMIERYNGGPVGIQTLAALVDEEERTIEEDHEPFMMRANLLEKTPRGRKATASAYRHLGIPVPVTENDEEQQKLF